MLGLLAQTLLALSAPDPGPVRFGVPLPAEVLGRGLALQSAGELQWRRLPLRAAAGLAWIEIAVAGGEGPLRVTLGGDGPVDGERGPALRRAREVAGGIDVATWSWCDGTVDRRERILCAVPQVLYEHFFEAGEVLTRESPGLPRRCLAAARLPREVWERTGLLPAGGGTAVALRGHLQQVARSLVELDGPRGAGDYARSGGTVTNLEFDTTLALLRLALALGDEELLLRARRAAWHLVDRDLDERTGLPFPHGPGHRTGQPEPGHAWLCGLLWTGAVAADEPLLAAARQIAGALAAAVGGGGRPAGGPGERARDFAWPLLELETFLCFAEDAEVAAAADALAGRIAERFDPEACTFRFGEGEERGGVYFERGWITGGVVLPALAAHLERRPDPRLRDLFERATRRLLGAVGSGNGGLATHWRIARGRVFGRHLAEGCPKALLMLEGLPPREVRRLLDRQSLWRWIRATPAPDDPDVATALTMVARCRWVYR